MTWHRKWGVAAVVAVGVLGISALAAGWGTPAPARARTVAVSMVTSPITIDPQLGETFAPAPAGAVPALTAEQAWARYTQVNTSYRSPAIPPNVSVRIGLLTLPIGPLGPRGTEVYAARNRLVYGYSWHSCPISANPKAPTPPPNPCIEWNFLDARTGHQIDETWQM